MVVLKQALFLAPLFGATHDENDKMNMPFKFIHRDMTGYDCKLTKLLKKARDFVRTKRTASQELNVKVFRSMISHKGLQTIIDSIRAYLDQPLYDKPNNTIFHLVFRSSITVRPRDQENNWASLPIALNIIIGFTFFKSYLDLIKMNLDYDDDKV